MNAGRIYLENDWYPGGIPGNVAIGESVFIDSSFGFARCNSEEEEAVTFGPASGSYGEATYVLGPHARVSVGPFTEINGTYLICSESIVIGAHCLLAWGTVLTDSWAGARLRPERRREILEAAARHPLRALDLGGPPRPITVEDNVWIGFDSVIMPGVTLGHGCIVGSKTVITDSVPPYAVMVGNPARLVRRLEPDDTESARAAAFREYRRRTGGAGNERKR